ncbi:energy-coupling factor transporter transmembrane protein EcfT [Bacillus sp. EAC]|uniref:energy-coupling factor transporter transmembrane component T family protein n=1 Tax=Bacillus sp. EAC TaxID=1978338 RepID=UPI000B43C656|nr:energy-coupling factor transporter transmembrane component T [Bacillus sp. EAC]
MNNPMLSYIQKESLVHQLTGATKLIFFLIWSTTAMVTYDTRILIVMFILGIIAFKVSQIEFKQVSFVLYFILFFMLFNSLLTFVFSPFQGVEIYDTRHNLFHLFGNIYFTAEQIFYQFNIILKYCTVIPIGILFIVTTNPSEFAASLNKIGVNYKIAYSVAIALRYIPDVQRDYQDITFAQQARGLELSKKQSLWKRMINSISILMPLIFSSLNRIEVISSAMELRGFGSKQYRTWYNARSFKKNDYIVFVFISLLFLISLVITFYDGNRFYNPFK